MKDNAFPKKSLQTIEGLTKSRVRILVVAVIFQTLLQILAMTRGVEETYQFSFQIQIGITILMYIVCERLSADMHVFFLTTSILSTGGFIQAVLDAELGAADSFAFGKHVIFAFGAFLLAAIILNRRKFNCLQNLFSERAMLLLGALSCLLSSLILFLPRVGGAANWIVIGGNSFQLTEITKFLYTWILGIVAANDEFERNFGRLIGILTINVFFLFVASEWGFIFLMVVQTAIITILRVRDKTSFIESTKKILKIGAMIGLICIVTGFLFLLGVWAISFTKNGGTITRLMEVADFFEMNIKKIQARFMVFLDPEIDPYGTGYQAIQVRETLYNAGIFGGRVTKIPVGSSDLVFAQLISILGLGMALIIMMFYFLFCITSIKIAEKKNSWLCMSFAISLTVQSIYNIAAGTIQIIPFSGITLPLCSDGGSSMLVTMLAIAVIISVSGKNYKYKEEELKNGSKKNQKNDNYFDLFDDFNDDDLDHQIGHPSGTVGGSRPGKDGKSRSTDESEHGRWDDL